MPVIVGVVPVIVGIAAVACIAYLQAGYKLM